MGRRPSAVATLVEHSSRYPLFVALPDGIKAQAVPPALRDALQQVPAQLRRSLAWDRGREMATHADLTAHTGCPVYSSDPKSPWQRGTNENTNRLLRQYLARSEDLRSRDQHALDELAARFNNRPRRVLGWRTPAEIYAEATTSHVVTVSGSVAGSLTGAGIGELSPVDQAAFVAVHLRNAADNSEAGAFVQPP